MNSARGFLPFANRIDDFAAAIGAVAAGENVRQIRLAGGEVARDGAVAIQSQFWKNLLQPIVLLLLANRLQDHIEGLDKFRTFNELKRAAAVAPRLDKTQSGDMSVFRDHLNRRVMEKKRSAVFLR